MHHHTFVSKQNTLNPVRTPTINTHVGVSNQSNSESPN